MITLKPNVGPFDRILRGGFAAFFFYLAFVYPETSSDPFIALILGVIALVNLIVAIIAVCPIYSLINMSTCDNK
ncbi:MAG: DUF2892 domain-containing protein [Chromatiales bacterium]|nr:DUF2892 domain-containing protein [Chromatiales bacterium]